MAAQARNDGHHPYQHRLVQHVPGQAPAPQPRQWRSGARHGSLHHRPPARQQPLPGRHTPPHHTQPGDERNVVLGDGLAADQAQPVPGRCVEELQLGPIAVRDGRQRFGRDGDHLFPEERC